MRMKGGEDGTTLVLNDGTKHPMIGFGTYKVGFIPASASSAAANPSTAATAGPSARECVRTALEVGYRFLDCAQFYGNEKEVGMAIQDSKIPRSELFLASKVWCDNIYRGPSAVRKQVLQTLQDLQTDYLDLYLIHWPVPGKHVAAYQELERLKDEGLLRSIGLSNYVVEDYEELSKVMRIPPSINQIEVNPFLYRKRTIDYFQGRGVAVQSYRSLRDGKAFDHPLVLELAAKHARTPAQILGRWCVQKGVIYIPKSVKRERMVENAKVLDFALDEGDVRRLDALTTPDAVQAFRALYEKCVLRDTPLAGTSEGLALLRPEITAD